MKIPDYIKINKLRPARSEMVAITTIHDPDVMWIDQLLAEYTRLDWEVAWHFNNLSKQYQDRLASYDRTIGFSVARPNSPPYCDYDHSWPLEIAQTSGARWVCVHNADETMEPKAPEMLKELFKERSVYVSMWYNVWEIKPDGTLMIRMDPPFIGHKLKFFPVGPWRCKFRQNVSTMYIDAPDREWPKAVWTGVRMLHWGFSTPELRKRHQVQWAGTSKTCRVHSDYWNGLVDPEYCVKAKLKPFDPEIPHAEFGIFGQPVPEWVAESRMVD